MLILTEKVLDDLKKWRDAGKTKREAVKLVTGTTLTTFNSAAKRAGPVFEGAVREIYPVHRVGPRARQPTSRPAANVTQALKAMGCDMNSVRLRAALMPWRASA